MADDKYLSGAEISSNLAQYEAARGNFFNFIIDSKINGILKADYKGEVDDAGNENKFLNATEIIKLSVVKCQIPHFSLQKHEFKRGNDTITFAGTPTFNSGSLTVDDFIGLKSKSLLMAWQNAAYNVHTRRTGRMTDYKFNCTLVEYTASMDLVRSWTLYGCWVSGLEEAEFDKENDGGKRQITATIEYDRAEMQDA